MTDTRKEFEAWAEECLGGHSWAKGHEWEAWQEATRQARSKHHDPRPVAITACAAAAVLTAWPFWLGTLA